MSNSVIELIRAKYEELEQLEKALVKSIAYKENNSKERVASEMMIKKFVEEIQKISKDLIDLNSDSDGAKREEIDILAGNKNYQDLSQNMNRNSSATQRNPDVWYNFYNKIKEIKFLNRKTASDTPVEHLNYEKMFNTALDEINNKNIFSAEENKGRCVDLHEIYSMYLNLKKFREGNILNISDYLTFLSEFDKFNIIPIHIKRSTNYKTYLKALVEYFQKFFQKSNPMLDINDIRDRIDDGFQEEWKAGTIQGYERIIKDEEAIDEKVIKDPLYCIPCGKLFANETVIGYHKKSKAHEKKVNQQEGESKDRIDKNRIIKDKEIFEEIAYYEYQIVKYKDLLSDIIENTKNQIRKKQSMNYDEMEADILNEKKLDNIDEDDDEDKPIYNPKNVPIGWDGKPIPYWLYKLHGLGVEFKCEICGGASYWGRKAFDRHFQEWRHSYGMKCLKIPNTVHFKEITSIEDALRLHQALIENNKKVVFNPGLEEEYEDSEGNVLNKKMFLDLKRQGII